MEERAGGDEGADEGVAAGGVDIYLVDTHFSHVVNLLSSHIVATGEFDAFFDGMPKKYFHICFRCSECGSFSLSQSKLDVPATLTW